MQDCKVRKTSNNLSFGYHERISETEIQMIPGIYLVDEKNIDTSRNPNFCYVLPSTESDSIQVDSWKIQNLVVLDLIIPDPVIPDLVVPDLVLPDLIVPHPIVPDPIIPGLVDRYKENVSPTRKEQKVGAPVIQMR